GLNTPEARAFLRESPIERADIVVTALGTNDVTSQQAPKSFREHYRALLDDLFERTGATSAIITGLPPLRILPAAPQPLRWYLGKYGARLDHELKSLCALDSRCAFLSLAWAAQPDAMAQDKFHPGPSQYAFWSRILCEHIGRFIGAFGDRRGRHEEPGDGA
ncbi:MAG: GDSL-type esterase/lipase family protein, partial [Pseudomonadota bacterium]